MVAALESEPVQMRSARDTERMLQSDYCDRELIEEQLKQKTLLDDVYDAGKGRIWKVAQFSVFPSDCKGSFQHRTRSGDKLQEISEWLQETKGLDGLPEMLVKGASPANPSFFLDLCAGPGTWSDWLLDEIDLLDQRRLENETHPFSAPADLSPQTATEEERSTRPAAKRLHGPSCYGFGISLNISDLAAMRDTRFWHIAKEVTERPNYESVTASNNSGNLYCSKNIKAMRHKIELRVTEIQEQCAALLPQADTATGSKQTLSFRDQMSPSRSARSRRSGNQGVIKLIVADGGITIPKKTVTGQHLDNYQELLTGRLLLSEFLIAFQLLQHGGTFICTVFDSFTSFTASLLFLCIALFEEVYIVKPSRNRWTNSERQLVALKFRRFRSVNLGAVAVASAVAGAKLHSLPSSPASSRGTRRPETSSLSSSLSASLSSSLSLPKKRPTVAMFPRVSRVYSAAVSKLTRVHEALSDAAPPTDYYTVLPETIFRRSFLKNDTLFVESYRRMCVELCRLQCISLQQTYAKFLDLQRNPGQLQELRQRQRTLERCMNALKGSAAIASMSTMARPSSCETSRYAGGDTPSPYGGDRTRRTLMDLYAFSPGTHFCGKYASATERGPNSPGEGDERGARSGDRTLGSVFSPAVSEDEQGRPRETEAETREREIEADWWRMGERRRQRGKAVYEGLATKTVAAEQTEGHCTQARLENVRVSADWSTSRSFASAGGESSSSWRRQDEERPKKRNLTTGGLEPSRQKTSSDESEKLTSLPLLPTPSTGVDVRVSNTDFWCAVLADNTSESDKLQSTRGSALDGACTPLPSNASAEQAKKDNLPSSLQGKTKTEMEQTAESAGKISERAKPQDREAETEPETIETRGSAGEGATNGIDAEVIYLIQAPEADVSDVFFQNETFQVSGSVLLSPRTTGEDALVRPLLCQSHSQNENSVSFERHAQEDACIPTRTPTPLSSFALEPFAVEQMTEQTRKDSSKGDEMQEEVRSPGNRDTSCPRTSSEEAEEENAAHTAVSIIESVLDCELEELNVEGAALKTSVMQRRASARLPLVTSAAESSGGENSIPPETFSEGHEIHFPSVAVSAVLSPAVTVVSSGTVGSPASEENARVQRAEKIPITETDTKLIEAVDDGQCAVASHIAESAGKTWSGNAPHESDRKLEGGPLRGVYVTGAANHETVSFGLLSQSPKMVFSQQTAQGRPGRSHGLGNALRRRITNQVLKTLNDHLQGSQSGSTEIRPAGVSEAKESIKPSREARLTEQKHPRTNNVKRESIMPEEAAAPVERYTRVASDRQKATVSGKHVHVEEDVTSTVSTLPTETIDIAVGIHVDESP
ncbi:ribosomal RNA large subunit methyltransferase J protein [Toxoplasma gondii MAS]|uniref:Cap-specific mRNA (nucleoside-2'-O-)-methyltransferase 1 n=1 Tax=Toxoplasma gondii MAS TaxID=943118 RepID=A0A086QE43_TOXGO|nr:ribosomal RNA large subunit methyltransferase J protein [Toxoplasma gondii MAS]